MDNQTKSHAPFGGWSRRLQKARPCRAMHISRRRRALENDLSPGIRLTVAPPHAQATPAYAPPSLTYTSTCSPTFSPLAVAWKLACSQHSFPSHMYRHTRVRFRYRETACALGPVPWGLSDLLSAATMPCRECCTVCRRALFSLPVIDHDGAHVNSGLPSD